MTDLWSFKIKAKNFKCFGEVEQGFDCVKLINLVIGRNNSGKSTLLDLISYAIKNSADVPQNLWHRGNRPQFIAQAPLTEYELKSVFSEGVSSGDIPGRNDWDYGQKFLGIEFNWLIGAPDGQRYIDIGELEDGTKPLDGIRRGEARLQRLADLKQNPLRRKELRRIYAERNITPEGDNAGNLEVSGDGHGVTNIIQNFINKAGLDSDLVETKFLDELNIVFKSDAHFKDIVCQQLENGTWEIYLEEETKGRIPLSQSGSGLKTIILVLVYIHLVPVVKGKPLSDFIFCFEELENNLHPALLRRLLTYLYENALKNSCVYFLTTHSNVEIDLFSKNDNAQIIHVAHDGDTAACKTVKTYVENQGVLDDLDVRASDLLQSNGVIWVEGPSDRIYVNRWIDLWSNGELSEGNHYQCVFYGGRLLSHLSSEEPVVVEDGVSILNVNRNSIMLIDSDKNNQQGRLNDTKRRIIREVDGNNGVSWVTKGKEIENYIPAHAVEGWHGVNNLQQVGQYDNFFDYLDNIENGLGNRYAKRKSLLAEKLCPHITIENSRELLDLDEKMSQICDKIRVWNNL